MSQLFFWIVGKKYLKTNRPKAKAENRDAQIIEEENKNNGAGDWIRTNDRLIANQELYQHKLHNNEVKIIY